MKNIFFALALIFSFICFLPDGPIYAGKMRLKIAMILWRGETSAERGFKTRLKELGYFAEYTIMNARQDPKELGRILRNKLEPTLRKFDYIYTFGTTVSKRTKFILHNRVPQLFNIVTDPVKSGLVKTMRKTGGNINGATHIIPVSVQIRSALKVFPFRKLCLIFNPREENSMIQRKRLHEVAKEYHFEVVDLRSPPTLDLLQKNLKKLIDGSVQADAVFLPSDSFLLSKSKIIGRQLRAAKIKSIGTIKKFIDGGALLGFVPDYHMMGKTVANIVDRHQKGEKIQTLPIQMPYRIQEPALVINRTTSEVLNFRVPAKYMKRAIFVD